MPLFHGVNINEIPTAVLPPRQVSASIPFVVGAAPVHLSSSTLADVLNKPVLINTYQEFVSTFGYSALEKYTLCEFADVFFGLYNVGPVVFVNVLDPTATAASTQVSSSAAALVDGEYTIDADAVLSTLVVKVGTTAAVLDTDYTAAYNAEGKIVITRKADSTVIPTATTELSLSYKSVKDAPIAAADIIGSVTSGVNAGLYCIEDVYPLHALIPGMIVCPGFSQDETVAAAMQAKCTGINSLFRAICLLDVDTSDADLYSEVNAWKNSNGYDSAFSGVCWPKVKVGARSEWMSSHLAGRIASTDADNDGVPFASPSNKPLQITGLVLSGGGEVILTIPQADTLNGQGVITGLQFNGWRLWGNRTGAYPGTTDPKDAFLSIRRMMNWLGNNVLLLLWQKLDDPINRRTIETAVDSVNQWLNGLVAKGALLSARMEFIQSENSNANLAAGKVTFHLYATPPAPAEQINVTLEYDVTGNSAIFS